MYRRRSNTPAGTRFLGLASAALLFFFFLPWFTASPGISLTGLDLAVGTGGVLAGAGGAPSALAPAPNPSPPAPPITPVAQQYPMLFLVLLAGIAGVGLALLDLGRPLEDIQRRARNSVIVSAVAVLIMAWMLLVVHWGGADPRLADAEFGFWFVLLAAIAMLGGAVSNARLSSETRPRRR